MAMQNVVYRLPDPTRLTFFLNIHHFREHLEKHFLSADEPWARLLGKGILLDLRQERMAGSVLLDKGRVEAAYSQVAMVLDEGIQFAEQCPLFVRCQMRRGVPNAVGGPWTTFYLIAAAGFVVIAYDDFVRTAYFPSESLLDPPATLFEKVWEYVRLKAKRAEHRALGKEVVYHDHVEWHSPVNWENCPNPHKSPTPATSAGKTKLLDQVRQAAARGKGGRNA